MTPELLADPSTQEERTLTLVTHPAEHPRCAALAALAGSTETRPALPDDPWVPTIRPLGDGHVSEIAALLASGPFGVLVEAEPSALAAHCACLSAVGVVDEDEPLVLRWYDPRVIDVLLPALTEGEVALLLGPIRRLLWHVAPGGWHRLERRATDSSASCVCGDPSQRLVLTPHHLRVFSDAAVRVEQEQILNVLSMHAPERFPDPHGECPGDLLHAFLLATRHGFRRAADREAYCVSLLLHDARIDSPVFVSSIRHHHGSVDASFARSYARFLRAAMP